MAAVAAIVAAIVAAAVAVAAVAVAAVTVAAAVVVRFGSGSLWGQQQQHGGMMVLFGT